MEETTRPIPAVLPDLPVTRDDQDKLDFIPYANTMREIILSEQTETPLTIGIFGSWGSGKTSLMRMIEQGLRDDAEQKLASGAENFRVTHPIWFNAWLYSKEDLLWRALISQVMAGIRTMPIPNGSQEEEEQKTQYLKDLDRQLYRVVGASQLGTLSIRAADLLSQEEAARENAEMTLTLLQGLDLLHDIAEVEAQDEATRAQVLRNEVQRATAKLEQERIESLDRFKEVFEKLIRLYVNRHGYLVIFVDDLDRCLPEKAVEVLEAIKLFLDVPGCIFVLGIDRDVVERGIRLRYGEMAGVREQALPPFLLSPDVLAEDGQKNSAAAYRAFLQELVRPEEDVIDGGRYLEKIIQIPFVLPPISREAMGTFIAQLAPNLPHAACGPTFYTGLEPNPRQVKRAINIFTLLWRLSQNLAENRPELRERVKPVRLAKMVVLQQRHPRLYETLRERPEQVIEWETYFRQQKDEAAFSAWQEQQGRAPAPPMPRPEIFEDYDPDLLSTLEEVLTMHPLTGALSVETNFVDLSANDARVYVYLTLSIEESVGAPPPDAMAKGEVLAVPGEGVAGAPPAGLVVGGEMDESAIGYLKERLYSVLEELAKEPVDPSGFSPDRRQYALERLAEAGGELFLQLSTARFEEMQAALAEPTVIRLSVSRGEAQMPLEVVYDGPLPSERLLQKQSYVEQKRLEVEVDGFWGFKHVIERPLFPVPRSADAPPPPQRQALAEIHYGERPRLLLALNPKTPSAGLALDLYRALAGEELVDLQIVEEFEALRDRFQETPNYPIVVFHTGGRRQRRDEIGVNLLGGDLTRNVLQGWAANRAFDLAAGEGPAPGRSLFVFDVGDSLGRRNEWPAYLETLTGLGAAGVVAPMSLPGATWSAPFIDRFLRRVLSGQAVGEALREARRAFLEERGNPLGLAFAHFGPAEQRLVAEAAPQAAA